MLPVHLTAFCLVGRFSTIIYLQLVAGMHCMSLYAPVQVSIKPFAQIITEYILPQLVVRQVSG